MNHFLIANCCLIYHACIGSETYFRGSTGFLHQLLSFWVTFHRLVSGYTGLCGNRCRINLLQVLLKFWADLGFLMLSDLTVSRWHALATKQANSLLGCCWQSTASSSREMILLLCWALVRLSRSSGSNSRLAGTRETWTDIQERVQWKATEMIRDWSISPIRKVRESWDYLVWKEKARAGFCKAK